MAISTLQGSGLGGWNRQADFDWQAVIRRLHKSKWTVTLFPLSIVWKDESLLDGDILGNIFSNEWHGIHRLIDKLCACLKLLISMTLSILRVGMWTLYYAPHHPVSVSQNWDFVQSGTSAISYSVINALLVSYNLEGWHIWVFSLLRATNVYLADPRILIMPMTTLAKLTGSPKKTIPTMIGCWLPFFSLFLPWYNLALYVVIHPSIIEMLALDFDCRPVYCCDSVSTLHDIKRVSKGTDSRDSGYLPNLIGPELPDWSPVSFFLCPSTKCKVLDGKASQWILWSAKETQRQYSSGHFFLRPFPISTGVLCCPMEVYNVSLSHNTTFSQRSTFLLLIFVLFQVLPDQYSYAQAHDEKLKLTKAIRTEWVPSKPLCHRLLLHASVYTLVSRQKHIIMGEDQCLQSCSLTVFHDTQVHLRHLNTTKDVFWISYMCSRL